MNDLFSGEYSYSSINAQLPDSLSELLNRDFVDRIVQGQSINPDDWESRLLKKFENNSLLDWTPKAPMRLFHGKADKTVDVENSINADNRFRDKSADHVEIILYDGLNHTTAAPFAIRDMYTWFESFRNEPVLTRR